MVFGCLDAAEDDWKGCEGGVKEELINSIVSMLQSIGIETDGIADRLYVLMKDIEIKPLETTLAVRDTVQNDRLIKRFLAAKMVKGCTPRTISMYGKSLHAIFSKFGKNCTDLTSDDIRLYIAFRITQDGIKKTTANNELRFLRTFYAWMFSEEIIPKNPMLKIDVIKQDKVQKKAFTDMECEKLRHACRTPLESATVEMLLSTGCRVSELAQMQIDDIKDGKAIVHGKGNKDRTVYLNAKAQLALQKYLSERCDNNPYLFPKGTILTDTSKPGDVYWYRNPDMIREGHRDKSSIEATVRKIGKRAEVEHTHPHRFRRTCATHALRHGMPIELVSKMLGHSQISTTQIYLDLSDDDLEAAHRKYVV